MIGSVNVLKALLDTMLMSLLALGLAYLVGLPLGVLLKVTSKTGLKPNRWANLILGAIVNFLRSIPCLIITVILLPLTRALLGKGTGEWYTMVIPLFVSSFAYVARIVEQSLTDVDNGKIEAIRSMGASDFMIVHKVLIPEARSSLLLGVCVTFVNIIGYTSFAYNIGAGGLIAEIYAYYMGHSKNFETSYVFWILIVIVVILVEVVQEFGLYLTKKLDKRRILK